MSNWVCGVRGEVAVLFGVVCDTRTVCRVHSTWFLIDGLSVLSRNQLPSLARLDSVSNGPQLGCSDDFGRCWEGHSHALLKDHRLVLIGHGRMHDWTVSVTFHVFLSALMRVRPRYLAHLHTVHEPLGEPLKHVHKMKCVLGEDHGKDRSGETQEAREVRGSDVREEEGVCVKLERKI